MKYKIVSADNLARIHESTVALLQQTGMLFHSDETVDIFKRHGAHTDGRVVRISRRMLERAIDSSPKTFTWHALNPDASIDVGGDQPIPIPVSAELSDFRVILQPWKQ